MTPSAYESFWSEAMAVFEQLGTERAQKVVTDDETGRRYEVRIVDLDPREADTDD